MTCIRYSLWALFAAVMLPAAGIAQTPKQAATVIYDHRGGNNPHISTQVGSELTLGGPGRIRVPTGEAACFSVRRANTLIYGYSLDAESLKGQVSGDVTAVIASLAQAIRAITPSLTTPKEIVAAAVEPASTPAAVRSSLEQTETKQALESSAFQLGPFRSLQSRVEGAETRSKTQATRLIVAEYSGVIARLVEGMAAASAKASAAADYGEQVRELATLVSQMEALRAASAADTSLRATVETAEAKLAEVQKLAFKMVTPGDEAKPAWLDILIATQKSLVTEAKRLRDEYATSLVNDRLQFCHTMQDARVRLHLVIAKKSPTGTGAAKPDTVATFVAEPESDNDFEVVPAFVASFGISGEKSFEVEGNVIREADLGPKFAPSAFAMWRVGRRKPYWAAVGTAPGRGTLPDAHLGLVLRLGEEVLKTSLVLGAGLTFAHTPIGLKDATVGAALPEGKTLKDVTRFGYRYGPTVFVSISGLSLNLGSPGTAASPDARK